jgi:hypothetical protein
MEKLNEIKVSIPVPCHEDWNKMMPDEKGAFCGKCAKTVVDFTKKTVEEIADYLLEQSGKKVCGRFTSDQLEKKPSEINLFIPLQLLPKRLSFNKAFILSLFIAFGTTLFSCSTQQGEVVGKIEAVEDPIIKKGETKVITLTGDTIYNMNSVNGQIKENCTSLKGDVAIESLGEVANPVDTTAVPKDSLHKKEIKTGKIKIK